MHKREANFDNLRAAITGERVPEWLPMAETHVDVEVMEALLGHRITNLQEHVAFWQKAGYDYTILYVRGQPVPDHFYQEKVGGICKNTAIRPRDLQKMVASCPLFSVHNGVCDEETFDNYPWIEPEEVYYDEIDAIRPWLPDGMKLIVSQGPLFSGIWRTMGMEAFSIAYVDNPDLIGAIAEKIGELCVRIAECCLQRDWVGAYWLGDDIAYRTGLMVSPVFLRRYVFPYYKRIGDLCSRYDKPLIWHSDGNHTQVLEDIIACGVDAVHPVEPTSVDIIQLKRQYGDRLTFISGMDVDLMSRGSPDEVAQAVRRLMDALGPGGGYVAGGGNSIPKYVPLENYKTLIRTVKEYGGIWRKDLEHERVGPVPTRRTSRAGHRGRAKLGV